MLPFVLRRFPTLTVITEPLFAGSPSARLVAANEPPRVTLTAQKSRALLLLGHIRFRERPGSDDVAIQLSQGSRSYGYVHFRPTDSEPSLV